MLVARPPGSLEPRNAQHSDVIFLSEGLCGGGNLHGRTVLKSEFAEPHKAEQLALLVLRLDNAVGGQKEPPTGLQSGPDF